MTNPFVFRNRHFVLATIAAALFCLVSCDPVDPPVGPSDTIPDPDPAEVTFILHGKTVRFAPANIVWNATRHATFADSQYDYNAEDGSHQYAQTNSPYYNWKDAHNSTMISNGQGWWRLPTTDEWNDLIGNYSWTRVMVPTDNGDRLGLIVVPQGFDCTKIASVPTENWNDKTAAYTEITPSEKAIFDKSGSVFFPFAGEYSAYLDSAHYVGIHGTYWTADETLQGEHASCIYLEKNGIWRVDLAKTNTLLVRLVQDVK